MLRKYKPDMAVVVDVQISHVINEQMIIQAFLHLTPSKIHLRHGGQILRTIFTNYSREEINKAYKQKDTTDLSDSKEGDKITAGRPTKEVFLRLQTEFINALPKMKSNLVVHESGAKWKNKVNIQKTIIKSGFIYTVANKNILKRYLDELNIPYA